MARRRGSQNTDDTGLGPPDATPGTLRDSFEGAGGVCCSPWLAECDTSCEQTAVTC